MVGRVRVARPVQEVFDRAVDELSWNPAMRSAEWLTPPPLGVGSRYRAVMAGRWATEIEITELDRPHRVSSRTRSAWLSTQGALAFTEVASSATVLAWDWDYRLHGPVRVLGPMLAAVGGRWERKNWGRLRDLLEQRHDGVPDLTGRTAVVTGANGGLGLQTAMVLAASGAYVVMAARNQEKAARALQEIRARHPDALLELVELDLASQASVRRAVAQILAGHDTIDILVNNAGLMATPESQTEDGYEMQLGVNHLGHWTLTALLMPALLAAPAARVVTVTSTAHHTWLPVDPANPHLHGTYHPWRAYGQSKLANYHFALGLQREFEHAGVRAQSLLAHPGLSHSDLQTRTVRGGGAGWTGPVWAWLARHTGMAVEDGARPQLRAATDPAAKGGEFYGPRFVNWGRRYNCRCSVPARTRQSAGCGSSPSARPACGCRSSRTEPADRQRLSSHRIEIDDVAVREPVRRSEPGCQGTARSCRQLTRSRDRDVGEEAPLVVVQVRKPQPYRTELRGELPGMPGGCASEIFGSVATLLNLDLDLVFVDLHLLGGRRHWR
jgi:NAD(P)-dependent dehydrogenase (short-subunit alcohol dehydrogenase family)